ncbi:MAG: YmdB family metallophosphoesterase [Sphaerochaetaceae bacterium]|nr:YmdB family metallophosphoesterase [Sphaerochaetaceae bacterium]
MRVLFLGEIVGRCGIGVIKNTIKNLRTKTMSGNRELDEIASEGVDFVVANAEGATGGYGCGLNNALSLHHMGIDVLTLGEKTYYKIDMVEGLPKHDRILRPANYPEDAPGRGVRHYSSEGGNRICVINLLGMMGFTNPHLNNPFLFVENVVNKALEETPFVFVIYHAQATAEKIAMGKLLAGKASAVVCTHAKVLTADASILENRTAYISDLGRCGSAMSVGGFDPQQEIAKYRTGVNGRSRETWENPELQGLLCEFDNKTGNALSVKTIRIPVGVKPLAQTY